MKLEMPKGPAAEEALRNYFLGSGYFVSRGCKFQYKQFEITDIDLWLYCKTSPLGRERLNVDVKNKKTPQAMERIFWTKGLQSILGLEGCIVATTDVRPDVREFGLRHKVTVLDGRFLGRLTKSGRSQLQRISEEDLVGELENASMGKLGGDWRGKYETSKSRLLTSLNFDGCNAWLGDIAYFLGQSNSPSSESARRRMTYISTAFFLISADFILREHLVAEQEQRRALLETGFRYGNAGKAFMEKVVRMAAAFAESASPAPGTAETIEREFQEQAHDIKAELLAEFLSKAATQSHLFDIAKELHAVAYALEAPKASELSPPAQSVLGVLADFCGIDRKKVLAP